jgi:hypothetical protein
MRVAVNNYFSVGGVIRAKTSNEGSIMPELVLFDDRRPDDVVRARTEALALRDAIKASERRVVAMAVWRRCVGVEAVPVIGEMGES